MLSDNQRFGHLEIALRADGEPVEVTRSPEELVFLAFDPRIQRLVELHILQKGRTMGAVAQASALERAKMASSLRGPAFMRVLEAGEEDGLVYYTSHLNDGEFLEDYIQRRGALHPPVAFSLILTLLDDLIQLKDSRRLVAGMRLDRLMMTTQEDTFLQLRLYDYGLSTPEPSTFEEVVAQVCSQIFLMLTGLLPGEAPPDSQPVIASQPMRLRVAMRAALADGNQLPETLEKLRDDIKEAFSATVPGIQARNPRKHLGVIPALQPLSQLQDLLLEKVPLQTLLGTRHRVEEEELTRRLPFVIPCVSTRNEAPVTVHLLPPSRIVAKGRYEAVPLQMGRFHPDKHPNILRSLSVWENPDWTFLTEEREPGFTLSRLMVERLALNPGEVVVLLKQVAAGIRQAQDCGVPGMDLHPSNIILRVGRPGPLLAREHERLMQRRLDAWPPFVVKLRAHLTMRHLYEPLLGEPDLAPAGSPDKPVDAAETCRRAFVFLASYLLTGERNCGGATGATFPDTVPDYLATFMRESLEGTRVPGATLEPVEFLERFEAAIHGPPTPSLADRLRGSGIPLEEMESAGSVSDFEEDWTEASHDDGDHAAQAAQPLQPYRHGKVVHTIQWLPAWPVWAAAALVLGLVSWWMFTPGHASAGAAASPAPATVKERTETTPTTPAAEPPNTAQVSASAPSLPQDAPPAASQSAPKAQATPVARPAVQAPVSRPVSSPPPPRAPSPGPTSTIEKATATPAAEPPTPPITVRRALLPTAEELARVKNLPVIHAPLAPAEAPESVLHWKAPVLELSQPEIPKRRP